MLLPICRPFTHLARPWCHVAVLSQLIAHALAGLVAAPGETLPARLKLGESSCPVSSIVVFLAAPTAMLAKRCEAAEQARKSALLAAAVARVQEVLQAAPDPSVAAMHMAAAAGRTAHRLGVHDAAAAAVEVARGRAAAAAAAAARGGSRRLIRQLSSSSSSSSLAEDETLLAADPTAASDNAFADHMFACLDQQAAAAHAAVMQHFGCVTAEQLQQLLLVCVEVCDNVMGGCSLHDVDVLCSTVCVLVHVKRSDSTDDRLQAVVLAQYATCCTTALLLDNVDSRVCVALGLSLITPCESCCALSKMPKPSLRRVPCCCCRCKQSGLRTAVWWSI
jgi:hypothetical protein